VTQAAYEHLGMKILDNRNGNQTSLY